VTVQRLPVTEHMFFLRAERVLLSRRFNTGYEASCTGSRATSASISSWWCAREYGW
jgi:hypothetical protein